MSCVRQTCPHPLVAPPSAPAPPLSPHLLLQFLKEGLVVVATDGKGGKSSVPLGRGQESGFSGGETDGQAPPDRQKAGGDTRPGTRSRGHLEVLETFIARPQRSARLRERRE